VAERAVVHGYPVPERLHDFFGLAGICRLGFAGFCLRGLASGCFLGLTGLFVACLMPSL